MTEWTESNRNFKWTRKKDGKEMRRLNSYSKHRLGQFIFDRLRGNCGLSVGDCLEWNGCLRESVALAWVFVSVYEELNRVNEMEGAVSFWETWNLFMLISQRFFFVIYFVELICVPVKDLIAHICVLRVNSCFKFVSQLRVLDWNIGNESYVLGCSASDREWIDQRGVSGVVSSGNQRGRSC